MLMPATRLKRRLVTRAVDPAPDGRVGVVRERCATVRLIRVAVDPAECRGRAGQRRPGLLLFGKHGFGAASTIASIDVGLAELATSQPDPSVTHVSEGNHEASQHEVLLFRRVQHQQMRRDFATRCHPLTRGNGCRLRCGIHRHVDVAMSVEFQAVVEQPARARCCPRFTATGASPCVATAQSPIAAIRRCTGPAIRCAPRVLGTSCTCARLRAISRSTATLMRGTSRCLRTGKRPTTGRYEECTKHSRHPDPRQANATHLAPLQKTSSVDNS